MANLSFLSLFCTIAVLYLSFAAVPSAHALQGMNLAPPMVKRAAEHVDLTKRMIKKKRQDTPANPAPDPVGGGNGTPTTTTPNPTNVPNTTTSPTTTTTSPLINLPITTKDATTTTTTSSSTTTSATSTSTTTTSQTTSATSTSTTQSLSRTLRSGSTVLVTQTAESSAPPAASDPTVSNLPHSVIIGLIVAGSCLAGGAAIWTIIRKWKFSPSRHFEDRLEPINWEPTQASGLPHDPTVAALERASSRNGGSAAGRGSLGSSDEHGTRNMTSVNNDQISMAPDFPPPHDFTAGPTAGGYGGAGYVDMHRGPSPAPGAYGASRYETPNPYDAYDYNNQYGQRRY